MSKHKFFARLCSDERELHFSETLRRSGYDLDRLPGMKEEVR